jgi:hypothetical protein
VPIPKPSRKRFPGLNGSSSLAVMTESSVFDSKFAFEIKKLLLQVEGDAASLRQISELSR